MLDPRIYRTGIMVVALAVVVVAFSLENLPGGLGAGLAPDAFNGGNAMATMTSLAAAYPDRPPGSRGDAAVADRVAGTLEKLGFTVTRTRFPAQTSDGPRTLENVTGMLAGGSDAAIVVLAHRDAARGPAVADLSGTAVQLELARLLAGSTAQHTIVIASTSGSLGAAGAAALARELPGPVDAVVALGDLAAAHPRGPVVVPWSTGPRRAPAVLARTAAGFLSAQSGAALGSDGIVGQLLHLAFPMTTSEQAPWLDAGVPAVEMSLSGERPPPSEEPTSPASLAAAGRAVLQSVRALDAAPGVPGPSGYLVLAGKIIPAWAVRLLGLALIGPVLLTVIDGLARARRRGRAVVPGLAWVLACVLAFLLGGAVVLLARVLGALGHAPARIVGAGAATPTTGGTVTAAVAALAIVAVLGFAAPRVGRRAGAREGETARAGAGLPALFLLSLVALVLWARNPFAALLLAPALHLWLWLGDRELPLPRTVKVALVLAGAAPLVGAVVYFALALDLSPLGLVWDGTLMIARETMAPATVVLWSIVLGCFSALLALAFRRAPGVPAASPRVTVRGPLTYAGPGSLGGTRSALRR